MELEEPKTIFVGNLSEKATEELLYELFLQAGPLERVKIPYDKNGRQASFGFITMKHDVSVEYTIRLLDGMPFFGRRLIVKRRMGKEQHRHDPHSQLNNNLSVPTRLANLPMGNRNNNSRFDERHNEKGRNKVRDEERDRNRNRDRGRFTDRNRFGRSYPNQRNPRNQLY